MAYEILILSGCQPLQRGLSNMLQAEFSEAALRWVAS